MLYYIRMGLLYPYLILICVFIHILAIVRPFHPNNMSLVGRMLRKGACVILGMKIKIDGEEYLNPEDPSVFICNHQTTLDIFICTGLFRANTVTLGKKELVYIPIFGLAYWLTGNILIERHKRSKAMQALKKVADKMKKRGTSILVFPEGTRNWGKGMLKFKMGAFNVALSGGCPIVPIVVEDYSRALNFNKFSAGTLHIKVLPPIDTQDLEPGKDGKELAKACQRTMEEVYERLGTAA